MSKKVIIRNIKHIQRLEFEIPESPGVYVLTGSNGSGKTTLMTCLLRIGWYRAFQDHFRVGGGRVDLYEGDITYSIGGNSVSYRHAGTRWPPTPRKNSEIFGQFGYAVVRFLPATGNRLYVQDQYLNPTDFRAVDTILKSDLNNLLETTKFTNLRYIQTASTRGPGSGSQRWKRAYVIRIGNSYYSEKNFSLGEILILNTLLLIQDVPDHSMLLIDELEMALHPRVQARLLKYLSEKAEQKHLTVILSTHSSTLIKYAKNLIYLENTNQSGIIKVNTKCYPAAVLREVSIEEDTQPDYVFVVEDDMAQILLKEIIRKYFRLNPSILMPIYKVLPIGGYPQVLEFAENTTNYLFNNKIGIYLFPDRDVVDVRQTLRNLGNNRDGSQQKLFEQFNRLDSIIKPLPITPELGLWNWLRNNMALVQTALNSHYTDSVLIFQDLIDHTEANFPTQAANDRRAAKHKLKYLANLIFDRTNEDVKRIVQFLFSLYVESYYSVSQNENILKATWGQILNRRGNILVTN